MLTLLPDPTLAIIMMLGRGWTAAPVRNWCQRVETIALQKRPGLEHFVDISTPTSKGIVLRDHDW